MGAVGGSFLTSAAPYIVGASLEQGDLDLELVPAVPIVVAFAKCNIGAAGLGAQIGGVAPGAYILRIQEKPEQIR